MSGLLCAALVVVLAFLGAPVFALMGALALWLFHGAGISTSSVIVEMLRLADLPALVAIPLFTAFTGASGVTIVALGGLLYPMLLRQGYSRSYSLGLITCTGSLGLLFPPSLPIILYGLVAKVSIDQLFLAGALPGIALLVVLAGYSAFIGRRSGLRSQPFSVRAVLRTARAAAWEIPLPVVIIGGIYGGFFTATD